MLENIAIFFFVLEWRRGSEEGKVHLTLANSIETDG